jgi:hypothetical protein
MLLFVMLTRKRVSERERGESYEGKQLEEEEETGEKEEKY